jgi:hypothetical protein
LGGGGVQNVRWPGYPPFNDDFLARLLNSP